MGSGMDQCSSHCFLAPNSISDKAILRNRMQWWAVDECSFTGKLAVEATQGNAKCLQCTHRIVVVHCEDVFSNTAKLHHNIVDCNDKDFTSIRYMHCY